MCNARAIAVESRHVSTEARFWYVSSLSGAGKDIFEKILHIKEGFVDVRKHSRHRLWSYVEPGKVPDVSTKMFGYLVMKGYARSSEMDEIWQRSIFDIFREESVVALKEDSIGIEDVRERQHIAVRPPLGGRR